MESSNVLKELADRERALTDKVARAREEAHKIVAEAESKAKTVVAQAETEAQKLTAEYRSKRETEEKTILESSVAATREAANAVRGAAEAKVGEAVKFIVSRVIP